MSPAACWALAATLTPAPPGPTTPGGCIGFGAEVAAGLEQTWPRGGVDRGFSLNRSRFDLGVEREGAGARLVLAGVRSGGRDSYIGVDGESVVPQVQVAEARYRHAPLGMSLAAGMVDDPWVTTANASWDLRATGPGVGEAAGWFERSDLGATVAWTSPGRWAGVAASMTTGEGLRRRERNNGQDTTGLLVLRPLAGRDGGDTLLEVQALGREGSRGLGYARDHRAGLRLTHRSDWAAGGAEVLRAWGVQGDAVRAPRALSAWAQLTPPSLPVLGWGRADRIDERPGTANTRHIHTALGLGVDLPTAAGAPARLLLGWDRDTRDAAVAPLSGAAATTRADRLSVQLDLRVREHIDSHPTPRDR